ncbi:hypothetical protein L1887_21881 [Cichorium endivia]|nr:hypothetical protein L1887_21881 [Cichorium endivia]
MTHHTFVNRTPAPCRLRLNQWHYIFQGPGFVLGCVYAMAPLWKRLSFIIESIYPNIHNTQTTLHQREKTESKRSAPNQYVAFTAIFSLPSCLTSQTFANSQLEV